LDFAGLAGEGKGGGCAHARFQTGGRAWEDGQCAGWLCWVDEVRAHVCCEVVVEVPLV
jgi:hypothetical protein